MILDLLFSLALLGLSASEVMFGTSYQFSQTVELSDKESTPVNYQIRANALIEVVHPHLLSVKLNGLKLFTQSKKLEPSHFKERKSILGSDDNNQFFIELDSGIVKSIYIVDTEGLPLVLLKKSFSSLLQFQTQPSERKESDISGKCSVKYIQGEDSVIQKKKLQCDSNNIFSKKNVWSAVIVPEQISEIVFSGNKLKSVLSKEEFRVKANIADFVEVSVSTNIYLELIGSGGSSSENFNGEGINSIVKRAEKKLGKVYRQHNLIVDRNLENVNEAKDLSFTDVLKDNSHFLSSKHLGTTESAIAALKILKAVKNASYNDIYNSLKAKKIKKITAQLLDILGAVQTPESYKAAMKFLKFSSKEYNLDLCERYLWALSTSSHHEKQIIIDLLKLAENETSDMKLLETLIQTVSSMVRKHVENTKDNELLENTLTFLSEKLKKCSKEDYWCQRIYLKSFMNLGSSRVVDLLIEYAVNGAKSIGPLAMRALWKLGRNSWNCGVLKAAERIYLSNGTYDSSAKKIALDILLESSKTDFSISKIIHILRQREVPFELKEYLLQRLAQISEKNEDFERNLKSVLVHEGLNHYDAMATGGLSTAFERRFMKNGYLSTTQEVKSGILKEGFVHINMEHNGVPQTMFTLGLFSNGLGSFVSDDSGDNDGDGAVTAGLELTVMGVEFRPFTFFEGHGELMGHVFSGAGSTLTPAYQAILLLEEDSIFLPIGTGELLNVQFSAVASLDLSGKIEISLWSRTADSLVQNSAGIITEGIVDIVSPYVNSQMKIELTAEPQLKLSSNIEFYNKIALCLSLEQPEVVVQFNTSAKTDVVEGLYKKSYKKDKNFKIPGRTYALNSKNNEMCRILFQES